MPALAPDLLIARHLDKLRSRPDHDKIDLVLTSAGLSVDGQKVTRGGRDVTVEDCWAYKQAVRQIYGEATYSFTKVNFVLGGCTCRDCAVN